jgi:CBS domain-containing protein
MGELNVDEVDHLKLRDFMRALIADCWAIEKMLETGMMESGVRRIGAEQEMFLVDRNNMRPAMISSSLLQVLKDQHFTTELAKFNLEANLAPRTFAAGCLQSMENELLDLVSKVKKGAQQLEADVVLAGILPTLVLSDLSLDSMTDVPRYRELNKRLSEMRGSKFYVLIKGLDELHVTHDNMMLEACNTSFQLHYQVSPEEFVDLYNLSQAITAPVLAAAVNSPILFGQRLWAETRLALFQHSVDERSELVKARSRPSRVSFGEKWVEKSILELFRADIARHRVLLAHAVDEDPQAVLERGEIPKLSALRLHNGTVWRWNRPCYGIHNGIPHLRVENRVLPSGPSIIDEVSNSAFFCGLMAALPDEYGPIQNVLDFDHVKTNFLAAARHGLSGTMHWVGGTTYTARSLVLEHLLPLARRGLEKMGIESTERDRYLGTIEERVRTGQTGSQWILKSLTAMGPRGTPLMRAQAITRAIIEGNNEGKPVHEWPVAEIHEAPGGYHEHYRTAGQFMSTDLFTVRPDDVVDYVASIMHWEHIRYVPVENEEGRLVGLVSQRHLLPLLAQGSTLNRAQGVPVHMIMKKDPVTVTPDTPTLEVIEMMRKGKIGCVPVVENGRLVGVVTLFDLLNVSAKLLEEELKKK